MSYTRICGYATESTNALGARIRKENSPGSHIRGSGRTVRNTKKKKNENHKNKENERVREREAAQRGARSSRTFTARAASATVAPRGPTTRCSV